MKFAHSLLFSGIAFGLGCATKIIYNKIKDIKSYKEYTNAFEDFLNFKDSKKYIDLNLGIEEKYIGIGIVNIIKDNKKDLLAIDLSKYEEEGNPIGITLGSKIVDKEDQYIIPEVEVYKFKNGVINYRFHQERGIIVDPNEGIIPFD